MASVTLRNICKSYDETQVTRNVNLDIDDGEFVVFVGPSGCGKSTLLRMIAGLEDITSGDLYIGNDKVNNLPPKEREVGMVFQSYALYPHMNVAENMAFGLKLAKTDKAEIDRRVNDAAKLLQLNNLLERKPKDLSSGLRLAAPSFGNPRYSCSMSPYPTSMPPCGCRCASRSPGCTSAWTPPWCTSPTTRWKP